MKTHRHLLLKLLFLGGLVIAADAALLGQLRRTGLKDWGKINLALAGRLKADVLVSGSSRALYHYDCEELERAHGGSCYNFGFSGTRAEEQLALLRIFLEHNPPPKKLVQNLDITLLEPFTVYNPERYLPYLGREDVYSLLKGKQPQAWKHRYIPFYGFAGRYGFVYSSLAQLLRVDPEVRVKGYKPMPLAWDGTFDEFRRKNPGGVNFGTDAGAIRALKEIADLGRGLGAEVIFVYSPELAENQVLTRNRAEIMRIFREIAADSGAALVDYSSHPISRRNELFYNSQHLNQAGAAAFSADLGQRLAAMTRVAAHRPRPPAGRTGSAQLRPRRPGSPL